MALLIDGDTLSRQRTEARRVNELEMNVKCLLWQCEIQSVVGHRDVPALTGAEGAHSHSYDAHLSPLADLRKITAFLGTS